jgi:hypothetical protein
MADRWVWLRDEPAGIELSDLDEDEELDDEEWDEEDDWGDEDDEDEDGDWDEDEDDWDDWEEDDDDVSGRRRTFPGSRGVGGGDSV